MHAPFSLCFVHYRDIRACFPWVDWRLSRQNRWAGRRVGKVTDIQKMALIVGSCPCMRRQFVTKAVQSLHLLGHSPALLNTKPTSSQLLCDYDLSRPLFVALSPKLVSVCECVCVRARACACVTPFSVIALVSNIRRRLGLNSTHVVLSTKITNDSEMWSRHRDITSIATVHSDGPATAAECESLLTRTFTRAGLQGACTRPPQTMASLLRTARARCLLHARYGQL